MAGGEDVRASSCVIKRLYLVDLLTMTPRSLPASGGESIFRRKNPERTLAYMISQMEDMIGRSSGRTW
jgi:hypothetical protein